VEFEENSKDLLKRVVRPVDEVLLAANLSFTSLNKVEMIGAGWRVPKVQEILLAHTKRPILDKVRSYGKQNSCNKSDCALLRTALAFFLSRQKCTCFYSWSPNFCRL
jgi:hypothetical protein